MLKQFGAIYLILGTCIAAGMLSLPIVTAQYHFMLTAIMIFSAWLIMSTGAWCLLQVNMQMPHGANFISMSRTTLGHTVKTITWFIYLMLLYSLICAYLSASGDLLQTLCRDLHFFIPRWMATILATCILGSVVYRGIQSVDMANRWLMSAKFIICMLLIGSVLPFSHISQLTGGNWNMTTNAWLVVITSFGYGSILPSVRDYLDNHQKQLTRVILIGGIVPMILYFIWIATIQGALPRFGAHSLSAMNNSANTNSLLMMQIASLTHHNMIKSISVIFISICSITGFLSVALSLMDVLTDGFKRERYGTHRLWIALLVFLPPTLIVIFDPAIFIRALAYAGVCCLYILVALPIAMYIALKRKGIRHAGTKRFN